MFCGAGLLSYRAVLLCALRCRPLGSLISRGSFLLDSAHFFAYPALKRWANLGRPSGADTLITAALKDRQTRILREAGILERKLAAEEDGATIGFDPAGLLAVAAQARVGMARIGSGPGGNRHGNIFSGRVVAFEAEFFRSSATVFRISRDSA